MTHLKASDVFQNTNFAFAQKTKFAAAFPQVESFKIEVLEQKDFWGREASHRHYSLENEPGEYINCNNSSCYNGGVSIGDILKTMVRENLRDFEVTKICQGNEGSPKGRKIYRKCLHQFKITASIEFKSSQENLDTAP